METLSLLLPLAWRNIWRNPRRTVITLIVVSAGMFSVIVMGAIMAAWAQSARDRAITLLNGSAQIHAPGFLDNPGLSRLMDPPSGALAEALAAPEIRAWAPRMVLSAVVQSEYRSMPVSLLGVVPEREKKISTVPGGVSDGRYLDGPDDAGIVLGRHLAKRLKTRLGKRVILMTQDAEGALAERSFKVVGLFGGDAEVEDRYGFVGLSTLQEMLGTGDRIAEIAIRTGKDANLKAVVKRLAAAAPELDVRSWRDISPMASMIDQTMGVFVLIWLWVVFILMSFGIVNTQLMAVFERVHEFGLMQALGLKPRYILWLVTLESLILVGLGVLIGSTGAVSLIQSLSDGVDISFFAEGVAMFGGGQVLYPSVDVTQTVELSLAIWVMGVVVALWPARKASKSSPVEAMTHVS